MFDALVQKARSLTASDWDLYLDSNGVEKAAADLNEGLAQALYMPTQAQAWSHIDMFMAAHKQMGALDTEPRALARRFFEQVAWTQPRPPYPLDWGGRVFVVVTGDASDEDDDGLQGIFEINVPVAGLDIGNPAHLEAIATAALDSFHEHQGIEVLDDFTITAMLADGRLLSEAEEPAAIHLNTDHAGQINVADCPIPVLHYFDSTMTPTQPDAAEKSADRG